MNYNFDYTLYHKYVNDIVELMDDLSDPEIYSKLHSSTLPILTQLGIALLKNDYEENARARGFNFNEFRLPPEMVLGTPNLNCEVVVNKKISDVVSVTLYAYPHANAPEWDDDMKHEVVQFITLYFHLLSRVRLLHMFESRIFHDQGLPFVGNLTSLMRDLGRLKATRRLNDFTIYRFNIYKFSRYNRVYGRDVGDSILDKYIKKLKTFSGSEGDVYRLGGDNFLGLIPNEMTPAVHRFFEGYTIKLADEESEVEIQSRVGFYPIFEIDITPDLVLSRVNSTFAKTTPQKKILYFDFKEEEKELKATQIENDFMKALKEKKVITFYQPKVNITNNKISSAEALCRWVKDDRIASPAEFISILERTNQICSLDFYMLARVCEDIRGWIDSGNEPIPISINFSRNNLTDRNFVRKIVNTLDLYKIPHDAITIELTETTMEVDFEEISNVVEELHKNDIKTAVDDFGMGYSSLNLIKDIKWDVLKIDKNFVPERQNANYEKHLVMLKNVIQMANTIGMISVVEGVETDEQLELCKECGCDVVQGFYFDKPLCKEEFVAKLKGTYEKGSKWHA